MIFGQKEEDLVLIMKLYDLAEYGQVRFKNHKLLVIIYILIKNYSVGAIFQDCYLKKFARGIIILYYREIIEWKNYLLT